MTLATPPDRTLLASLGWAPFFADQMAPGEAGLAPVRIVSVHRHRLGGMAGEGPVELVLPPHASTGDYAVGDWVLADPGTLDARRRLERRTLIERRLGNGATQLGGANIDTLFIVTSCNGDFNTARLERYLALANQAGITPVMVLTKADTAEDAALYTGRAAELQRDLPVVVVDPRRSAAAATLAQWCGRGQTVAVVGSSGVGKSTLVNTLTEADADGGQLTGGIRESDAKGRHTTTSRSMHPIAGGGWVIDTPGIRTLHVSDMAEGLDTVFAEITELAPQCRFRDCTHAHEPGCAVQAAVAAGTLDPDRLARWRKLQDENAAKRPTQTGGAGKSGPRRRG
jgi:ribosome biogenesis GTPase